jgi:transmembrane sensor
VSLDKESLEHQAFEKLLLALSAQGTEADAAALGDWRGQSAGHEAAFRTAAALYASTGLAAQEFKALERGTSAPLRASGYTRRAVIAGASTSALAAGFAGLAFHPPLELWRPISDYLSDYATRTGERRTVQMARGIAVEMNTRTQVNIAGGVTPAVTIKRGEIAVTCPAGAAVTINAAGGSVSSAGGTFGVRYVEDHVSIICIAGRAQIRYGSNSVSLEANERLTYGAEGIGTPAAVPATDGLAWRNGFLVFHGETLAKALREINRYRSAPILLGNEALAGRRLTARLNLDRLEDVIVYFERTFGAYAYKLPGGIVLLV